MNWNLYFSTIKCQEDYDKLKATGMVYELFDSFPNSWYDHYHLAEYIDSKLKTNKIQEEVYIPSWAKPVDCNSYDYRRLITQFPICDKFYFYYDCGDYYTRASTTYYDQDLNELCSDNHNHYG